MKLGQVTSFALVTSGIPKSSQAPVRPPTSSSDPATNPLAAASLAKPQSMPPRQGSALEGGVEKREPKADAGAMIAGPLNVLEPNGITLIGAGFGGVIGGMVGAQFAQIDRTPVLPRVAGYGGAGAVVGAAFTDFFFNHPAHTSDELQTSPAPSASQGPAASLESQVSATPSGNVTVAPTAVAPRTAS